MSSQAAPAPALTAENLTVRYGGVRAVEGVSLTVPAGQVVALLGANGAGKSSTLAALAGSSAGATSMSLAVFGQAVRRPRAHRMARIGVAFIPGGGEVFAPLTVHDNLLVGGYLTRSRARLRDLLDEVYGLFPVLRERRANFAGLLSGGEQRMLAFGRALMCEPRLILMDEPSMGLAPIMVDRIMAAVRGINERGTSILLAEQNAVAALRVSSHAYVLERGRVIRDASAADLAGDPIVAQAFLGLRDQDPDDAQSAGPAPGAMLRR